MPKPIECKEGRGVLFPRQNAEGNQPTLRGALRIGDCDYEVSGWTRTSKAGRKYISLSIQLPYAQRRGEQQPRGNGSDDSNPWDA